MPVTAWIIFAIAARLFMAMGKTIDRHIADAYGHRRIISAIVLQNVTAILSLCLIALFHGVPQNIDSDTVLWVNIGVVAYLCAHYPYLKALQKDEARNVIPLFEMTPFILAGWAFIVLGETMTPLQTTLALAMVVGGFLFMWDAKKCRFKALSFGLMLISSLLMALYFLAMRVATRAYDPLDILWMIESGFFMAGFVMLIVYPRALGNIKMALTHSRGKIILWEFLGGICFRLVSACMVMALALAPVTGLVAAFSGVQPLFSAALGLCLLAGTQKPDWRSKTTWFRVALVLIIFICAGLMHIFA